MSLFARHGATPVSPEFPGSFSRWEMPGASSAGEIRVIESNDALDNISSENFVINGRQAPLALAFISPHVDFARLTAMLPDLAGKTPVIAVSTAGVLSCVSDEPLYKPTGQDGLSIVLQIFPADLFEAVSIHSVPLLNERSRKDASGVNSEVRIEAIAASLLQISVPFVVGARDTLAYTLVDGLSYSENYFMEAVYRVGKFPCAFVGGSTGGTLDFQHSYIFDGEKVLEDHALMIFMKLASGKSYGIMKSQNFKKTGQSFVVMGADPDRRVVAGVLDMQSKQIRPFATVLAEVLQTTPERVMEKLSGYTFGIEVGDELYVRSVSGINTETGIISFFCDVNSGDRLELLETTDFVQQTRQDLAAFMKDRPKAIGAILNDCVLRRLNNENELHHLANLWPMPAAGFSTFGELFGINVNQTLTAVVFFDESNKPFHDPFIEMFPVYYANFVEYYTRRNLNCMVTLNRIREGIVDRMTEDLGASIMLIGKVQDALHQAASINSNVEEIRQAIQANAQSTATKNDTTALLQKFSALTLSMNGLRQVLNVIDTIAGQTNLLALNATMQAAQAGVAGREFSTFIDNVKKLAQDTKENLLQINASMGGMDNQIVALGNNINNNINDACGQLLQTQESYNGIVMQIEEMFSNLQTINQVISSLEDSVRDRAGMLMSLMDDIDTLKRIV